MSQVEKLEQARALACTQENIYAWFHAAHMQELPVTSSVILNSEASCSEATEKLPSIIASSKMGAQMANETTCKLAHLTLVHLKVIQFTVHYCS